MLNSELYTHLDSVCECACHVKTVVTFGEDNRCPGLGRVIAGDPRDRLCCALHDKQYINSDGTIDVKLYINFKMENYRRHRRKYEYRRKR